MNDLHFGVCVGINNYPQLRPLNYALRDAQLFYDWLTSPNKGGVPTRNARLVEMPGQFASRADAKPIRHDVFVPLYEFHQQVVDHVEQHPDDWEKTRLYFYCSGHGIAPEAQEAAILMANAGPGWFGENIGCAKLLDFFLTAQTFKEVVIFADCCREFVDNARIGDVPWDEVRRNNGHIVWSAGYAAYFGDIAHEPTPDQVGQPDDRRGFFTRALLEGLEGNAAVDGRVTSRSLSAYVKARVQSLTADKHPPQIPQFPVSDETDSILFRSIAELEHEIVIHLPDDFAGSAALLNGRRQQIAEYQPGANGQWRVRLAPGLYRVKAPNAGFRDNGFFEVFGEERDVRL